MLLLVKFTQPASMVDEWIWYIGGMILTERQQKWLERNLYQDHLVSHKSHMG
jgi:hypothetical protein